MKKKKKENNTVKHISYGKNVGELGLITHLL